MVLGVQNEGGVLAGSGPGDGGMDILLLRKAQKTHKMFLKI